MSDPTEASGAEATEPAQAEAGTPASEVPAGPPEAKSGAAANAPAAPAETENAAAAKALAGGSAAKTSQAASGAEAKNAATAPPTAQPEDEGASGGTPEAKNAAAAKVPAAPAEAKDAAAARALPEDEGAWSANCITSSIFQNKLHAVARRIACIEDVAQWMSWFLHSPGTSEEKLHAIFRVSDDGLEKCEWIEGNFEAGFIDKRLLSNVFDIFSRFIPKHKYVCSSLICKEVLQIVLMDVTKLFQDVDCSLPHYNIKTAIFIGELRKLGHGNMLKAWRNNIDLNGCGVVTRREFMIAVRRLSLTSECAKIWEALAGNNQQLELHNLEATEGTNIDHYVQCVQKHVGLEIADAWTMLDAFGTGRVTAWCFDEAAKVLTFAGDSKIIYNGVKARGVNHINYEDFRYIFTVSRHPRSYRLKGDETRLRLRTWCLKHDITAEKLADKVWENCEGLEDVVKSKNPSAENRPPSPSKQRSKQSSPSSSKQASEIGSGRIASSKAQDAKARDNAQRESGKPSKLTRGTSNAQLSSLPSKTPGGSSTSGRSSSPNGLKKVPSVPVDLDMTSVELALSAIQIGRSLAIIGCVFDQAKFANSIACHQQLHFVYTRSQFLAWFKNETKADQLKDGYPIHPKNLKITEESRFNASKVERWVDSSEILRTRATLDQKAGTFDFALPPANQREARGRRSLPC